MQLKNKQDGAAVMKNEDDVIGNEIMAAGAVPAVL